MTEKFIEKYVKLIATKSDQVSVERTDVNSDFSEITVYAAKEDIGKIIGKDGHMISAIKTMVSGCKAKDGVSYKIMVKTVEEQEA